MACSEDGTMLAVGWSDGSLCICQGPRFGADVHTTHAYREGGVGSVHFIPASEGYVLVVGNSTNATLRLLHWAPAQGESAMLRTLRFEGRNGQQDLFMHAEVVPEHNLVVLVDTPRKAIFTVHYAGGQPRGKGVTIRQRAACSPCKCQCQRQQCLAHHRSARQPTCAHGPMLSPYPDIHVHLPKLPLRAGHGHALHFDYVARFHVGLPVISFTAFWNPTAGDDGMVELNCVQTEAIQQYMLDPALCYESERCLRCRAKYFHGLPDDLWEHNISPPTHLRAHTHRADEEAAAPAAAELLEQGPRSHAIPASSETETPEKAPALAIEVTPSPPPATPGTSFLYLNHFAVVEFGFTAGRPFTLYRSHARLDRSLIGLLTHSASLSPHCSNRRSRVWPQGQLWRLPLPLPLPLPKPCRSPIPCPLLRHLGIFLSPTSAPLQRSNPPSFSPQVTL
jgi:hypothetical protein